MGWTDERLEADLDAEAEMPEHVDHPADTKQGATNQGETVPGRQHPIGLLAAGLIPQGVHRQEGQDREHPRVEDAMPRGDESLQARHVAMGPGVKVGPRHQPGAEADHHPFEWPGDRD